MEDKAHKARIRKHGSNYLLETYLKGLPDAVDPTTEEIPAVDKNSDSGVVTEGDSEQSNPNKPTCTVQVRKLYLLSMVGGNILIKLSVKSPEKSPL